MKLFFNIVRTEYIKWLKNDKQIITAFSLICLYMYVIEPIKNYSLIFGEPINVMEPFIIFLCNEFCIPIIILTFTVLMIDFPDIGGNATFLLIRTGRTKWYKGQVMFIAAASLSFILLLFIFSVIFTARDAFFANLWSNAERLINHTANAEIKNKNPLAYLDLSVINNFTVAKATAYSIILMFLHLVFTVQLQTVLSLRFNKITGLCGNVILIGLGLLSYAADSNLKWIFPLAHSTINLHYDELYNKVNFPVPLSLVYMLAINAVIYFIGKKVIKNKNLTLLSKGD